jgi:microcystin-dependent protein
MTDFNTPTNTTTYTSVLSTINDKISSVAKMIFSSDTNIPVGTLQYNRTTRIFEEWDGSGWTSMRVEPAGVIKAFGGATAPSGHVLCNGTAYNTYTYRELHKVISNQYGGTAYSAGVTDSAGATTTFNVPNLKGRFPLGKSDSGTGSTIGDTGGAIDHTHDTKAHYHGMGAGANLNITASGASNTGYSATSITVNSKNLEHTHSGATNLGDGAHNHDSIEAATSDSTSGTIDNIRITGGTQIQPLIDNVVQQDGSAHQHNFTTGGMNSNVSHDHPITDPTHRHSTPDHTHGSSAFAGSIGTVTGGVDGNVAQATTAANPPFQVVNYIISI